MIQKYADVSKEHIHCSIGPVNIIWLCSHFGTDDELRKVLEHSTEGIDNIYGEHKSAALHMAMNNLNHEYRLPNIKLLLEYGADPNAIVYSGLAPLHIAVYSFMNKHNTIEYSEKLILILLGRKNINPKVKGLYDHSDKTPEDCCDESVPTLKVLL